MVVVVVVAPVGNVCACGYLLCVSQHRNTRHCTKHNCAVEEQQNTPNTPTVVLVVAFVVAVVVVVAATAVATTTLYSRFRFLCNWKQQGEEDRERWGEERREGGQHEPFKTPARQRQTIPRLACLDTVFGMNAVLDSLSFNSLNLVFSSSFSASLPLEVMLVVASWGDRPTHGRQCDNRSWPLRTQHHSRECPIEILSFDTGRRVRHRFA